MTTPFGSALRQILQNEGKFQRELAKQIGVTPSHLSEMINGKRPQPSKEIFERIIRALDSTPEVSNMLTDCITLSNPRLKLPATARPEEYQLIGLLRKEISNLDSKKLNIIISYIES